VIAAVDPGSARAALVIGEAVEGRPVIRRADVFPIDTTTIEACATSAAPIVAAVAEARPELLLLEAGNPYVKPGAAPQVVASIARNLMLQDRLCQEIKRGLAPLGIQVQEYTRASWSPRVIIAAGLLADERSDAKVRAALEHHLDVDSMALVHGADIADAAGLLVWYFLPAPKRGTSSAAAKDRHRDSARESYGRRRVANGHAYTPDPKRRRNAADDAFDALLAAKERQEKA
jgi:hypothetical protein